jgi:hypothetical protein
MTKDDLDLDLQAGGKALTFEEAIAHYPEQAAKAFKRVGAECMEQTEAKEAAYEKIRKLNEDLLQQKTLNADLHKGVCSGYQNILADLRKAESQIKQMQDAEQMFRKDLAEKFLGRRDALPADQTKARMAWEDAARIVRGDNG